jgi:integration host factor subunit alpha
MNKKNLTRENLSNQLYKKIGFSKSLSGKIVDNFFEIVISELIETSRIKISSFGTFKVIKKNERLGRNPKTKIEYKIKPRKVVSFKTSSLVKKNLNNNE